MMTFILIKRKLSNDNRARFEWWEQDGDKLFNQAGGWNNLFDSDVIIKKVKAKNWDALFTPENIAETSEYKDLVERSTDKSLKIGWLEPNGKMHYCRYQDHITYVDLILDSTVDEIEKRGWIHIYKGDKGIFYPVSHRVTVAQADTLRNELGLEVCDEDILYQ